MELPEKSLRGTMSSMMDQLTTDVTENVISQITGKLLPAISTRYDIPLDELLEMVNSASTKQPTIKAKPKKKDSAKVKATPKKDITPEPKKPAATSKALTELQEKISAAKTQGKLYNATSGRPVGDTTANRKKYKFYDELGVAGTAGDSKLTEVLKLLGAPSKKEIPVHQQAARAKARAKKSESDQESNSSSKSQLDIPAPKADDYLEESDEKSTTSEPQSLKKAVAKKPIAAKSSASSSNDSSVGEPEPLKKAVAKKVPAKKSSTSNTPESSPEPPKKVVAKKTPAKKPIAAKSSASSSKDSSGEPPKKVVAKKTPAKKLIAAKSSASSSKDSSGEPPKKVVAKKPIAAKSSASSSKDSSGEPPKKVVAKKTPAKKPIAAKSSASNAVNKSVSTAKEPGPKVVAKKAPIKKKPAAATKPDASSAKKSSPEEKAPVKNEENLDTVVKLSKLIESDSEPATKGKQPQARYNSKIKEWWNPDTTFVLKRKGIKSFVFGKVDKDTVVALTTADLKKCKELGWVTDTTILNKKNVSESESN